MQWNVHQHRFLEGSFFSLSPSQSVSQSFERSYGLTVKAKLAHDNKETHKLPPREGRKDLCYAKRGQSKEQRGSIAEENRPLDPLPPELVYSFQAFFLQSLPLFGEKESQQKRGRLFSSLDGSRPFFGQECQIQTIPIPCVIVCPGLALRVSSPTG